MLIGAGSLIEEANADELAKQGDALLQAFLEAAKKSKAKTMADTESKDDQRLSQAKASYQAALKKNSKHLPSLIGIIKVLFEQNEEVRAIPYLDLIMELDPTNFEMLNNYIVISYMVADYAKVIRLTDQILAHNDDKARNYHADALLNKGRALLIRGKNDDYTSAQECFKRLPFDPLATCYTGFAILFARKLDPRDRFLALEPFYDSRAKIKAYQNLKLKNAKQTKEYNEYNMELANELALLGIIFCMYPRDDDSLMKKLDCFKKKEAQLTPNEHEYIFWQGVCLRLANASWKAIKCFDTILARISCVHSQIQKGIIFFSQNNIEAAHREFKIVRPPNSITSYYLGQIALQRARLYRSGSYFNRELTFLREAHGYDPSDQTITAELKRAAETVADELKKAEETVAEHNGTSKMLHPRQSSSNPAEPQTFTVVVTPPPRQEIKMPNDVPTPPNEDLDVQVDPNDLTKVDQISYDAKALEDDDNFIPPRPSSPFEPERAQRDIMTKNDAAASPVVRPAKFLPLPGAVAPEDSPFHHQWSKKGNQESASLRHITVSIDSLPELETSLSDHNQDQEIHETKNQSQTERTDASEKATEKEESKTVQELPSLTDESVVVVAQQERPKEPGKAPADIKQDPLEIEVKKDELTSIPDAIPEHSFSPRGCCPPLSQLLLCLRRSRSRRVAHYQSTTIYRESGIQSETNIGSETDTRSKTGMPTRTGFSEFSQDGTDEAEKEENTGEELPSVAGQNKNAVVQALPAQNSSRPCCVIM